MDQSDCSIQTNYALSMGRVVARSGGLNSIFTEHRNAVQFIRSILVLIVLNLNAALQEIHILNYIGPFNN